MLFVNGTLAAASAPQTPQTLEDIYMPGKVFRIGSRLPEVSNPFQGIIYDALYTNIAEMAYAAPTPVPPL